MSVEKIISKRNLLLLTSGGDSPGMNAAIRSVVRSGLHHGFKIFACHDGFHGLVEEKIFPLKTEHVAGCIQQGGTIFRSGRSSSFRQKEVRSQVNKFLQQKNIDHLVVIGGDGSFRGAALLEEEGGPTTIGIPGTIDNDIVGTDYTIGYDTARNTAMKAIDNIRDTSASSGIYFLIETMGRQAGFLAVDVGIAAGAEHILVPEYPITVPELAKRIAGPKRKKHSVIIVISEAETPGRSFNIAQALKLLTPQIDYRVCVLGHTQRGGSPSAKDRIIASMMGNFAVQSLLQGKSKCMIAIRNDELVLAPFPNPEQPSRSLTNMDLINLSQVLAI